MCAPVVSPIKELAAYTNTFGVRALSGGFVPLLGREFVYIAAITAVNPAVTQWCANKGGSAWYGVGGAFTVGLCAGILSAPLQTLSAMQKSETNRGSSLRKVLQQEIFSDGCISGLQRLYFGGLTRSVRTGAAGVLYYTYRSVLTPQASS